MDLDIIRDALNVTSILDTFGLKAKLRNGWHRLSVCPRCGDASTREAIAVEAKSGRWLHHGKERSGGGECSGDVFDFVAACASLDVRKDFPKVMDACSSIAGVRQADPEFQAQAEQRRRRRDTEELQAQAQREAAAVGAAEAWPHLHRRHVVGEMYLAGRSLDVHELIRADAVRFSNAGDPCVALRSANGIVTSIATRFVEPGSRPKVMVRKGTGTAGTMVDSIDAITAGRDVVIVEGVCDALTARLAWPAAVILGANGAGNVPKVTAGALRRCAMARSTLRLIPHHDEQGIKATTAAATIAQAGGLELGRALQICSLPQPDLNAAWASGWRP